jgi:hypothetical protein
MSLDPATAADLGALLHQLSHNPKTRKMIAKAIKEAKPDSPHAQAFKDVEVEDRFEEFTRQQEDKDLKRAQEAMLATMNQKRAALLTGGADGSGRKYDEDGVKKIEEVMQRYGISDYDAGATLYAATLPPVEQPSDAEPPQHGATWEFPEWGKFGADPVKASRDTAHNVITEFMRKR